MFTLFSGFATGVSRGMIGPQLPPSSATPTTPTTRRMAPEEVAAEVKTLISEGKALAPDLEVRIDNLRQQDPSNTQVPVLQQQLDLIRSIRLQSTNPNFIPTPLVMDRLTYAVDVARATLGGHEFVQGDKVVLWYWSGNRDEAVFTDPHVFDIGRTPNEHIGFGGPGPHFCLGAHLARREMTVMFSELLRRVPDIHATAEPARLRSGFINGIKHLPCAWTPAG